MSTEIDKAYFLSIKHTLNPPFKKGERIVVSNGSFKRFNNASDAAKYIITELKKDCYVYRGEEDMVIEL